MTLGYHEALVYICASNEMPMYFLYKENTEENERKGKGSVIFYSTDC